MQAWMKELSLASNISELGATEDMLEAITDSTFILEGGYKKLSRAEVSEILRASL